MRRLRKFKKIVDFIESRRYVNFRKINVSSVLPAMHLVKKITNILHQEFAEQWILKFDFPPFFEAFLTVINIFIILPHHTCSICILVVNKIWRNSTNKLSQK